VLSLYHNSVQTMRPDRVVISSASWISGSVAGGLLAALLVVVVAAVAVAPSGLYVCFVCWLNAAKLVTLCLGGIVVVLLA